MELWIKISLLLCTFGFFRELRPSEPFVTEFLSGEWRNVTSEQLNRNVYPFGTYSYLALLIIVFLVTDILRYKPIIIVSAVTGIILWSILLWTTTLTALQIGQVFYGTFMATEIAYYTYIYAKVERSKYQLVTGHTRSAMLCGRFTAGVLGQLLVSFELMNLRELNYISLGSQIISLILSIILPSIGTSIYFYTKEISQTDGITQRGIDGQLNYGLNQINDVTDKSTELGDTVENNKIDKEIIVFSWKRAIILLWEHFKAAYTNQIVIQWSIWWALAMCGFIMVQSYVQLLWQQIDPESENLYNGAIEAALTLLGAISAFSAGFVNSQKLERFDLWILTGCSALEGALILWAATTTNVWIAYVTYVLFGASYHFMITFASAMVAKKLFEDSFALIFGINTLISLIFQAILTVIVISEAGFALDPRGQFLVYGSYFIGLAVVYAISGVISKLLRKE